MRAVIFPSGAARVELNGRWRRCRVLELVMTRELAERDPAVTLSPWREFSPLPRQVYARVVLDGLEHELDLDGPLEVRPDTKARRFGRARRA